MSELLLRGMDVVGRDGPLLRDVSLHLYPGAPLGLVGPSGSGKTMLARALLGLLPGGFSISGGQLSLNGDRIRLDRPDHLSSLCGRRIGYLLQHPHQAMDPVARVGVQMLDTLREHERLQHDRDGESTVLSWLNRMDFSDPELIAKLYPFQLSGGMARRVYLAMILMLEPEVLIADEPTAGLDGVTAGNIMNLIRRESGERALMIITHDVRILSPETDRIAVMVGGELVEEGPAAVMLDQPEHPYTRQMVAAVFGQEDGKENGWDRNARDGFCGYRVSCPVRLDVCDTEPVPRHEREDGWVRCHRCS